MTVLASMQAMRTQRKALFASLVLFLWHKFRPDATDCGTDCC
ncbi:hypothetical protein [Leptothoe sp. PORK10 BA2]|nr:hypothetical protein [Leptothoe sp. PORK10 BA2]MEA5462323.1 hypothetical protein [Leptothoe sp. PORK10 BA2]